MSPICSRNCPIARSKSSRLLILKPSREPDDLIGLTKNGNPSPARPIAASASSSNGSKAVKAGMWSPMASRYTSRLQYLCSHFSRLSRDVVRVPNASHRIGSMVDTGTSM